MLLMGVEEGLQERGPNDLCLHVQRPSRRRQRRHPQHLHRLRHLTVLGRLVASGCGERRHGDGRVTAGMLEGVRLKRSEACATWGRLGRQGLKRCQGWGQPTETSGVPWAQGVVGAITHACWLFFCGVVRTACKRGRQDITMPMVLMVRGFGPKHAKERETSATQPA